MDYAHYPINALAGAVVVVMLDRWANVQMLDSANY